MAVRSSTRPKDIAAIREAADAEADARYAPALASVRDGGYLLPDQIHALRHRRNRTAADLKAIADDATASPAGRAAAAVALADIRDPAGAERAAAFLTSPSRELQFETVKRLNGGSGEIDWSIPGTREALLGLIRDADEHVALTGAALAQLARIPGAEAAVLTRIDCGHITGRAQWVGALSAVANTPEAAARATQELFHNPPERYWTRSLMYHLYWVCNHRDPAVRGIARAAAREFLLGYLAKQPTEELIAEFALVAGPEDMPFFDEILATARKSEMRAIALGAIARLNPARAVEHVLANPPRRRLDEWSKSILLDCATEADAARVIPLIRPSQRELTTGYSETELERVVNCLRQLGEAGRTELRDWIGHLRGAVRVRAEWALRGIMLRPVLESFVAAGALPGDDDTLMEQLQSCAADDVELDEGDPGLVGQAFGLAGRAVSFHAGNGPIGSDRDRLREFTAERTGDLFVPECPVVETEGGDENTPATVRFLHGDRAFSFETKYYRDPYDVAAVIEAANTALKASGHRERFLALPTLFGPVLILTDPAKFRPVAQRFCLMPNL
jgi:hypothetical protein